MATREQLIQALVAADRAGNAEDAKALAAALKSMPVVGQELTPERPTAPTPPAIPTAMGMLPPLPRGPGGRLDLAAAAAASQATPEQAKELQSTVLGFAPFTAGPRVAAEVLSPVAQLARKAIERGFKVPPAEANPTMLNSLLQTLGGGKTAVEQAMSVANQPRWNIAIKRALGIPDDVPLTRAALEAVRSAASKAYEAVKTELGTAISIDARFLRRMKALQTEGSKYIESNPETFGSMKGANALIQRWAEKVYVSPEEAIAATKQLRADASTNLRKWDDQASLHLGRVQRRIADSLDALVEDTLKGLGKGAIAKNYRMARETVARSYDVQAALNETTGNVSAQALASLLKKNRPLSAELREVAEFARAFPRAARPVEAVGAAPGVTPTDVRFGAAKAALTGQPGWLAEGLIPPAVRALLISAPMQRALGGGMGAAASPALGQLYRGLFGAAAQTMPPPSEETP